MNIKHAVILLSFAAQVHANEDAPYRFSRDVLFEAKDSQQLLAVPLDSGVYAGSSADFSDLRLIDHDGAETPYTLQKITGSKTVTNRVAVRAEKPVMAKSGQDGIVISVKLAPDETCRVDGLTIVTGQRDFEYQLQVQGSADGDSWQTLANKGLIYDYSRHMDFGNRDVELSDNDARQFKITVAEAIQNQAGGAMELTRSLQNGNEFQREEKIDILSQPLRIERIELWRNEIETVAEAERRFDYPIAGFEVRQDHQKQITEIDVDARLLP
ncbi:MAG: hypothetical protein PHH11_14470, partial [Methylomonas sp.]|nr:hypothetical protein [Methylomonas sp.]